MPEPAYLPIDRFAEDVRRLVRHAVAAPRIQRFLADTRIEPGSLERFVRFEDGRYTRHLVLKTPEVEVLVLCWRSGARAPVHGHEGELCWARVERGRLRFTAYRELARTPLALEPVGPPVDGGPGHLDGPADIHAVDNPAEFGEDAVTVHVYSRPYDECDIYDLARGSVERVRLRYDSGA
jgi:hypothetical protein